MNRFGKSFLVVLFLTFISALSILGIVNKDLEESYWENRTLVQHPTISIEKISDGSFTKEYEEYFTDQFPKRDFWVKSYIDIQRLTNQTFINDYYIDGKYIFPAPLTYFAKENVDVSIAEINKLGEYTKEKGIEFYYFVLPARKTTLAANYPSYVDEGYDLFTKDYIFNNVTHPYVKKYDIEKDLQQKYTIDQLKSFYYLSDHHWNSLGALKGYESIVNILHQSSQSLRVNAFNEENYTEIFAEEGMNFLGSYNRQLYNLVKTSEERTSHFISNKIDYNELEVYIGSPSWAPKSNYSTVFGTEMNGSANGDLTYGGIFTGDYRELHIINPALKEENTKVLVVKDSYVNPLKFLLAENFYQTTFFDLRYNTDRSLISFIEENDFDAVLLMYNGTTIFNVMYNFEHSY